MSLYPDRRSAVLPALRAAQEEHGWLSPEAMEQVAAVMQVTPAYLESVASFYDMLELQPVGRHTIYVCTNLSCQLRGARDVLGALSRGDRRPGRRLEPGRASSTCARSSAWAPATSPRWPRSRATTAGR